VIASARFQLRLLFCAAFEAHKSNAAALLVSKIGCHSAQRSMDALLFIAARSSLDLLAALLPPSRVTNWFEAFVKLGKRLGLLPSQFNCDHSVRRTVRQLIKDAAASVGNCVQQVLNIESMFSYNKPEALKKAHIIQEGATTDCNLRMIALDSTLPASPSGSHGSIVIPSPSGSAGVMRKQPISTSVDTAVLLTRAPQVPVILDAHRHLLSDTPHPWMFKHQPFAPGVIIQ